MRFIRFDSSLIRPCESPFGSCGPPPCSFAPGPNRFQTAAGAAGCPHGPVPTLHTTSAPERPPHPDAAREGSPSPPLRASRRPSAGVGGRRLPGSGPFSPLPSHRTTHCPGPPRTRRVGSPPLHAPDVSGAPPPGAGAGRAQFPRLLRRAEPDRARVPFRRHRGPDPGDVLAESPVPRAAAWARGLLPGRQRGPEVPGGTSGASGHALSSRRGDLRALRPCSRLAGNWSAPDLMGSTANTSYGLSRSKVAKKAASDRRTGGSGSRAPSTLAPCERSTMRSPLHSTGSSDAEEYYDLSSSGPFVPRVRDSHPGDPGSMDDPVPPPGLRPRPKKSNSNPWTTALIALVVEDTSGFVSERRRNTNASGPKNMQPVSSHNTFHRIFNRRIGA